jgi:hypothetical protein
MKIKRFNQVNENVDNLPNSVSRKLLRISQFLKNTDFLKSEIEESGVFEFVKTYSIDEDRFSNELLSFLSQMDNVWYENSWIHITEGNIEYKVPLNIGIHTDDYDKKLENSIWLNLNVLQKKEI